MLDTRSDPRPRAVVIGSGFGGLAAAVRLGARGYKVTVFEALDQPGGRAYTYRQDGYTFDAGPTIITAPYLFDELWALCGKRFEDHIDLRASDPYYDIRFDDGRIFRYSGDQARMREQVAKFNPDDLDGFERFMDVSADIYKTAFEELADVPFDSLSFTLRSAPDLIRLGGYRSVYDTVCKYFTDPNLRLVFSFHPLLIGGNPLTTTAYYCLIAYLERQYGVHYAMGGTGALVRGLVDLIEGQGGEVICDAPVDRITVEGGTATGVVLTTGERVPASVVVSNADSAFTYSQLLRGTSRKRWTDGALKRRAFSMSLFVWYFGTDRKFDDVQHHTMVLGPRYEELLNDIFKRKRLAEDFSLYLHRPTASDPSLAPEGCDSFYVLSPVPNLLSGTDWSAQAEPYRQKIQERLEETVLPGLGDAIVTQRVLTPQDFQDRLSSVHGAAFSIEPKLFQSAWFRPHNRSEEARNLFLVGAGTHPGAGVPGVLSSARVLDRVAPDASVFAKR
ncbi:MAG: phytoene desaturase [Devosiaceae bacterium]|nr:phytoene desaturase [Devosiaceae bacterium MH13]